MRISDWSSDVCSSDLQPILHHRLAHLLPPSRCGHEIGGPAHDLGPRADRHLGIAQHDRLGALDDRLEARTASTVAGMAWRFLRNAGSHCRETSRIGIARLGMYDIAKDKSTPRITDDTGPRHTRADPH